MPEATVAKIMLWGAVRFAMYCYIGAAVFAGVLICLKDQHKRNWMGAMAMTFALIATFIVAYYFADNKQETRIELLKTLYYYPDRAPYHQYEGDKDDAEEGR